MKNPVDTGHKLNIHKTFRIRPGRLLNVLCTFNLRPVSTGKFVIANCVYASESSSFVFLENGIKYNAMIFEDIIRL